MPSAGRTERSRRLILEAADRAFREKGFAAASVEEIASRAGLTRKTIYNLFGSKEEIAHQLIAHAEAQDQGYRARMAAGEDALGLLEAILLDSAGWCLANPSIARLALAPAERPRLEPPTDRPSFQGLIRDVLRLGQRQAKIRDDEDADFMSLVLLGVYGQAMLNALAGGPFDRNDVVRLLRLVVEGVEARDRG
ncbi:MAG: TetR/AcrR family transcriptional regulator [Brevundimonas sp.]